jgi:hypothetical protein
MPNEMVVRRPRRPSLLVASRAEPKENRGSPPQKLAKDAPFGVEPEAGDSRPRAGSCETGSPIVGAHFCN